MKELALNVFRQPPDRAEALKAAIAARLGLLYCKEIRAAKVHPCATCVAQAAELLVDRE